MLYSPQMRLQADVSLAPLTTFKIGGPAKYYTAIKTRKLLIETAVFAKENDLSIFVLGEGSDILIDDQGVNALVIQPINQTITHNQKDGLVTAGAGAHWDNLVQYAVKRNLQGIECLSGIPGSVGAAPVQNIGAYGQELSDSFAYLQAFDLKEKRFVTLSKEDCQFEYRESIFKKPQFKGRFIIWSITLKLNKDHPPTLTYQSLKEQFKGTPSLQLLRQIVLQTRLKKLDDPNLTPNAGSFFKNPIITKTALKKLLKMFPELPYLLFKNKVKLFSAWLIEQVGFKGKVFKNVAVSEKNALVLVNKNNGTSKQLLELADLITKSVQKKFGVKLEPEVQYISI